MKIYEVDGRKVWLNEPPQGYKAPKKEMVEPKAEVKTKAKTTTKNKARKAESNK